MPRVPADYVPSLRLHRQSGQGIVTLSQRDFLLGKFGTPAATARYHQLVADWLAGGRKPLHPVTIARSTVDMAPITVGTLCDAFQRHADVYYATPGRRTNASAVYKLVLNDVRDLFGTIPADEFSPKMLKKVRERWIDRRYVRKSINSYTGHVRHVFRWGVEEEMLKPDVVQALECVAPLTAGRTRARESIPVKPVPLAHVNALETYVATAVWSLIQVQLHSGARGDELFRLRAIDVDTSGPVWTYRPARHKTAGKGHSRMIPFGPQCQRFLRPLMASRPLDAFLFSPREANAERKAAAALKNKRRRPNQTPNNRKTKRRIREHYDDASYRAAIQRACLPKNANVPRWHPHQLRHNFTTQVENTYGLEDARAAVGHTSIETTKLYAERDAKTAMRIAAQIG